MRIVTVMVTSIGDEMEPKLNPKVSVVVQMYVNHHQRILLKSSFLIIRYPFVANTDFNWPEVL